MTWPEYELDCVYVVYDRDRLSAEKSGLSESTWFGLIEILYRQIWKKHKAKEPEKFFYICSGWWNYEGYDAFFFYVLKGNSDYASGFQRVGNAMAFDKKKDKMHLLDFLKEIGIELSYEFYLPKVGSDHYGLLCTLLDGYVDETNRLEEKINKAMEILKL